MAKNLVVVESPAKCKTIKKYLGPDFEVLASFGHVRDLIPKEGAVSPENDFEMKYAVIERNQKHIDALVRALKKCDTLLLATDPDREGEAISYHVLQIFKDKNLIKDKAVKRVVFHEITKSAVKEGIAHPRELSMNLVNAQQARRALDYLVGFTLSPLLWRKIRPGLSAGRVQSPALRLIVEREAEIEAFEPKEYWSIEAKLEKEKQAFSAKLVHFEEKLTQFSITKEDRANEVLAVLREAANGQLKVARIEKKQRKRNPAAPFTTSTLQQEASRKLGFTSARTMRTAQQLYEGIDVGEGQVGLISYMRTDSVSLAEQAIEEIRAEILRKYGKGDVPKEPKIYKNKSKNAQEAHEAIRPTSIELDPDKIKHALSADQLKLYRLIWRRTLACQMIHATIDTVSADLECNPSMFFRASGSTVAKPGFLQVYEEGLDDQKKDADQKILPPLKEGELIDVNEIVGNQHFTEPPPRFSEATLIKTIAEHGIGRPSTYTAIISTLQTREYAVLVNKRFHPTDVARVVNRFLTSYFTQYVDYGFTAALEDNLDAIASGENAWKPVLKDFWEPFQHLVQHTHENVQRKDVTQEALDEKCPKCDEMLSIRLGKRGRFIGCKAYPECDYTRSMDEKEGEEHVQEVVEGRSCPNCESDLIIRKGRYGKFIGCSSYPKCKFIEPLEKPKDSGVQCPKCNKANILERRSRAGKVFYSCEGYPKCDYALWSPPYAKPCPECKWPITMIKTTKRSGTQRACPQKECKFIEDWETETAEESDS